MPETQVKDQKENDISFLNEHVLFDIDSAMSRCPVLQLLGNGKAFLPLMRLEGWQSLLKQSSLNDNSVC